MVVLRLKMQSLLRMKNTNQTILSSVSNCRKLLHYKFKKESLGNWNYFFVPAIILLNLFFVGNLSGQCNSSTSAQSISEQLEVLNASNILGAANGTIATLEGNDPNDLHPDVLAVDLGNYLPSGATITIRWRKTTATNGTIRVLGSEDYSVFKDFAGSPFSITNSSLFNTTITLTKTTRYIKFIVNNQVPVGVDAITYSTAGVVCPSCAVSLTTTVSGCYYGDPDGSGPLATGSYATVNVEVAWQHAPNTNGFNELETGSRLPTINVTLGSQTKQVYQEAPFLNEDSRDTGYYALSSPQVVTFVVAANGTTGSIAAAFSNSGGCSATSSYTAPSNCNPVICNAGPGTLGGRVFQDFNGNGNIDGGESVGYSGAKLKIYDCNTSGVSVLLDSMLSNTTGDYFFTGLTDGKKYRIEMTIPSGSSFGGTTSETSTNSSSQFRTPPNCNINYGILDPVTFIPPAPNILTTSYSPGKYTATGADNQITIHSSNYNANGLSATSSAYAFHSQTGAVYGLAHRSKDSLLFSSAVLKRHTGFGPLGIAGVYVTDLSKPAGTNASNAPTEDFLDLSFGGTYNFGTVGARADLANTVSSTVNIDATVFNDPGTKGIGDIDLSSDGDVLYAVNLFDKTLYQLDISGYNGTVGTLPTAANVTIDNIPNPCGASGNSRPWAVKVFQDKVYVGVVCDAAVSQDQSDLRGYVYVFDPISGNFNTTPVFDFPLTYPKGVAVVTDIIGDEGVWEPWNNNYTMDWPYNNQSVSGSFDRVYYSYPQPMITDIEFDVDGTMILVFNDRTNYQIGATEFDPTGTFYQFVATSGDILRAVSKPGGAYVLESNGIAGDKIGYGSNNKQGPGYGEFYNDNWYNNNNLLHTELVYGGAALTPGSGEIIVSVADPIDGEAHAGGYRVYDNKTGLVKRAHSTYTGTFQPSSPTFGKAGGTGDIELFAVPYSDLEIGNRVWNDANQNGVQDPCEDPISSVLVELWKGGTRIAQTYTNANGEYFFSSKSSLDNPSLWTGTVNDTALIPLTAYQIRVPLTQGVLTGLTLTTANSIINTGNDLNDNDGTISGTNAVISITTSNLGTVNHTYDFGFFSQRLGDKVWRDDDKDGVQDLNEPGVVGISVQLIDNSNNIVGSTVTDAYGLYYFNNLDVGDYKVKFLLPSNYSFTTQSNTVDNTNGAATKELGSDADATTGLTYTINISGGETELNIDAGIIFNETSSKGSAGDKVWYDTDSDGVQDANEPGVSGILVDLYDNSGNILASTLTDATGYYLFKELDLGNTYKIGFNLPPGMIFTTKDVGTDVLDSDPETSGVNFGKTPSFTLTTLAPKNLTLDAGIISQPNIKAALGDFVWEDLNRDGIQDAGEPGIANVTVELYDKTGTTLLNTTKTNALGYYIFNDLNLGEYKVKFIAPSGYLVSPVNNTGISDAKDSDMDPTTGFTGVYQLENISGFGYRDMSVDAGMYKNVSSGTVAALGDFVWYDYNRNGIQESTEVGVPGVSATLLTSSNSIYDNDPITSGIQPYKIMTDYYGKYNFVNLVPGTYKVQFSNLPNGYSVTTPDLGGSDILDSDGDPTNLITASVTLAGGDNNTSLDLGIIQGTHSGKATLGNFVWYDVNTNGIQDLGETGVPNITVQLFEAGPNGIIGGGDDVLIGTKQTTSKGEYIFENLEAGKYFVEFSNFPATAILTTQNVGSDIFDSDGGTIASGISRTGLYSLSQGEDNLTVDLGIYFNNLNRIGNYVWFDLNNNGLQNSGEPGVPGVQVILLDGTGTVYDSDLGTSGIQPLVSTTDNFGYYSFNGLPNGSYSVKFSNLPAGFTITNKNVGVDDAIDSDVDPVTFISGVATVNATTPAGTPRTDLTLDLGLVSSRCALGNFVWEDKDGDGIQDSGEPGIPGVTVTLYDAITNLPISTYITDYSGYYYFGNLNPGDYKVGFTTVPVGLVFTEQTAGSNLAIDSDPNSITGITDVITLTAGEVDLSVDAGLKQPILATVGDYVWFDEDMDGLQDNSENGVPGVLSILYNTGTNLIKGDSDDEIIGSAITNGSGFYQITNIPPATNYYIVFQNTPSSTWTTQNSGGGNAANESKSNTLGVTTVFGVAAGGYFKDFDGGLIIIVPLIEQNIKLYGKVITPTQFKLNWNVDGIEQFDTLKLYRYINGSVINTVKLVKSYFGTNLIQTSYLDNIQNNCNFNYFLVGVLKNGSSNRSNIVTLSSNCNSNFKVVPNPANDLVTVFLEDETANYTITITDMAGKVVTNSTAFNSTKIQLPLNKIVAGNYLIKVVNNKTSESRIERLVVLK